MFMMMVVVEPEQKDRCGRYRQDSGPYNNHYVVMLVVYRMSGTTNSNIDTRARKHTNTGEYT